MLVEERKREQWSEVCSAAATAATCEQKYAPGFRPDCGRGTDRLAYAGQLYVQENLDKSCLPVQGFEPDPS